MTLPEGWAKTTLGDCQGKTSSIDPRKEPETEFDLFSVPAYSVYKPDRARGHEIGSTKQEVRAGDVLLCKIVPHIRRAWAVPSRSERSQIASGEWIVLRDNALEPEFLRRFVLSDQFHGQFMQTVSGVGGSLMRARPADAAKIAVPVPPAAEQRRIVAKLDSLTARLARARAELDRVQVLAERLRSAALETAFSSPLQGDARHAPWPIGTLNDVGQFQLGKMLDKAKNRGEPRPYLRNINVRWRRIDQSDLLSMPYTEHEIVNYTLRPGDVLICEGGEPGRAAVWNERGSNVLFQKALHRIRPDDGNEPELIVFYLIHLARSGALINHLTGTTIKHLPQVKLKAIPWPIIPLNEQRWIVTFLGAAFTRADRIEAEAARSRALIDRLEAAILGRAFRGELVPQDPEDEPASVLLNRIRAQRAAALKPKRARR